MTRWITCFTLFFCTSTIGAQSSDSLNTGILNISSAEGIEELRLRYLNTQKTANSFPGYRVQIYNGRKNELLKKRAEFLSVFPNEQAYTVYDSPEYKLQIGDFRTRLEAEKFLKKVVKNYGSGFIVRSMIKPPALEPAQ